MDAAAKTATANAAQLNLNLIIETAPKLQTLLQDTLNSPASELLCVDKIYLSK
jgi:hypothetical protein